jgi:uncharacterized protein (DUF2252 family)
MAMPASVHDAIEPRSVRRAAGKALRKTTPLDSHAEWKPAPDRPDPLAILRDQDEGRMKDLLPIKYGRMVETPFAFLRGSAAVMAADLAGTPSSGITTMLCGDAHIANFGVFASPERKLVFDINDFDEASRGPWEWDLKRLAASATMAARELGMGNAASRKLAARAASMYGKVMDRAATMRTLDVWYYHVDADAMVKAFSQRSISIAGRKLAVRVVSKARERTQVQALDRMTEIKGDRRRFRHQPPLLVPFEFHGDDRLWSAEGRLADDVVTQAWSDYRASVSEDRRWLLGRFRITDAAFRVGGVGSVGTRCMAALLEGGAEDDALILQLKEAGESVVAHYGAPAEHEHNGQRVVMAQRLMQSTTDIFLGWNTGLLSLADFYWRQLKDMKGSFDLATMDESALGQYVSLCAWCLARAHARAGDAASIAGYIGSGRAFSRAIGEFAAAYADQTVRDHAVLTAAVDAGEIEALRGV